MLSLSRCFPLLSLLLVVTLRVTTAGDNSFKMVVINGAPLAYTSYTLFSQSFDSCVTYCYTRSECVAVYAESEESADCWVFGVTELSSISVSSQKVMGVKMTSTSSECPSTSDGNSMSGYVVSNDASSFQSYVISSSSNVWTLVTSTPVTCPTNFTLFTRPLGAWCIGVVTKGVTGCVTQADSLQECASVYGGVLSGLESVEEHDYVVETGRTFLSLEQNATIRYGYWINGARNTSCMATAKGATKSAGCNGTNEFTFTDPLLSTYAGYIWGDGQPSGISTYPTTSNCVSLNFDMVSVVGVDDYLCDQKAAYSLCYNGYACGVKPS